MKIEEIKEMFDKAYGFDLSIKSRVDNYVQARKTFCKLTRDLGFGLQTIGDAIDRDHATALHSVRTCQTITEYDSAIYERVFDIVESTRKFKPLSDNKYVSIIIDYEKRIHDLESEIERIKGDNSISTALAREISNWENYYIKDFIETRLKPYKIINKL